MLGLTGFFGLTRIPLCFWAHTDLTDPTVLLCRWEISQIGSVYGLARTDSAWFLGSHGSHRSHGIVCGWEISQIGSVRGLAHTDPTLLLGSHGSHRSHGIALWVGNLTDWLCVWAGSHGFRLVFGLTRISQIPQYCFVGGKSHRWLCAWACVDRWAARGSLSRIYFSDPSDKSDLSDKSDGLDIFKNNP